MEGAVEVQDNGTGAAKQDEDKDNPDTSRKEAESLFRQLSEKYGEVKFVRRKTYADLARAGLARLSIKAGRPSLAYDSGGSEIGLEIDMTAPEIEGLDTNGRPMRLSAYRGNVVVLDFWGDW
jgi:hypothetical protein